MKIDNSYSNIAFEKTLKAKGAIIKNNNPSDVSIYLLDEKEDMESFKCLKKQKDWRGSYYLYDMAQFGEYYFENGYDIYTLEDDKENVLAYSLTKRLPSKVKVSLLEVAPTYSRNNENRNVKFIGETLVSFLAKTAKQEHKDLYVKDVANRTKTQDFYFSLCKFQRAGDDDAILRKKTIPKLLKSNENHTGKKIELIV